MTPSQLPFQLVPRTPSEVKRMGCEAGQSPPFSAEVKHAYYASTPSYVFMAWCWIKHGNIYYRFHRHSSCINWIILYSFPLYSLFWSLMATIHRLYGLVVRVSGYRSRGPEFDSRPYQIFWEIRGLERGPLSLVRTIEELMAWKSSSSGLENRD
jgi:hypothetical protein